MFDISAKLVSEQDEIYGVKTIDWEDPEREILGGPAVLERSGPGEGGLGEGGLGDRGREGGGREEGGCGGPGIPNIGQTWKLA